jgi:hypothetical protein
VVVKDGTAVATAYRGETGKGDHAEYTAMEKKMPNETLAGAPPQGAADPTDGLRDLQRRFVEAQDRFPREVSFALVMIPHDERQAWKAANKWFDDMGGPPQKDGWRCLAFASGGDTPETITIPASESDDGRECPLLYPLDSWRCWILRHSPTAPYPCTALNMFYSLAVDACRLLSLRACGTMLEGRHIRGSRGEYQHLLRWSVDHLDPEECRKLTWLDPPHEHIRTNVRPGRTPRRWIVEMPCVFAAVAHALERHIGGLGKGPDGRRGGQPAKRTGRPKNTEKDSASKVIAALNVHHGYEGGSVTNYEPAKNRQLAGVSKNALSRFLADKLGNGGHKKYVAACQNASIGTLLRLWNGETPDRHAELRKLYFPRFPHSSDALRNLRTGLSGKARAA